MLFSGGRRCTARPRLVPMYVVVLPDAQVLGTVGTEPRVISATCPRTVVCNCGTACTGTMYVLVPWKPMCSSASLPDLKFLSPKIKASPNVTQQCSMGR